MKPLPAPGPLCSQAAHQAQGGLHGRAGARPLPGDGRAGESTKQGHYLKF